MDNDGGNDRADGRHTSVKQLYKNMLHRDPGKRRVKPVEQHLMQLHFNMSESEDDDSDFEFNPAAEGGDNDDDEEDDDMDDDLEDNDSASDGAGSDSGKRAVQSVSDTKIDVLSPEQVAMPTQSEPTKAPDSTSNKHGAVVEKTRSKVKVLICSICLGERSEAEDEIIECDGCGILVHEGCYGVAESQSNSSSGSSGSTEPWFCDACKAGVMPACELCPNFGGIFKQTDTGRWVHLVCALYVPGVAFGDVDKLTNITLLEMSYSKWGAKTCSLCEDERFSQTGVCVGCDAGMCRSYFHVSCAQREGLLSEAPPDQDIADPFYAHCKLHAEKQTMKMKKRNWLAVRSHVQQFKERSSSTADSTQARVQRKLAKFHRKFTSLEAARPPAWVNPVKQPRAISSSATALRRFMKKASMLGITTQAPSVLPMDIRKRAHVAPALTVEFAAYFHERNAKIVSLQRQVSELSLQNSKLQEEDNLLRKRYEELLGIAERQSKAHEDMRCRGLETWRALKSICAKLDVPLLGMKAFEGKLEGVPNAIHSVTSTPDGRVIHPCGICKRTQDQHLLAECDKCRLHYHLGCLDPPLVRMPRKTKQQGWQCSQCIASDFPTSDEVPTTDPSAPRRLRESIKEPIKFALPTPKLQVERMRDRGHASDKGRRPGRGRKPKNMAHGHSRGASASATCTGDRGQPKACKREGRPPLTRGKRARMSRTRRASGRIFGGGGGGACSMPGLSAASAVVSSPAGECVVDGGGVGKPDLKREDEEDDELPVLKKEKQPEGLEDEDDDDIGGGGHDGGEDDDKDDDDDDDYNPEHEARGRPRKRRSIGAALKAGVPTSSDTE